MIETNYVPIYMKINNIFFVIKGQFPVMDYISITIMVRFESNYSNYRSIRTSIVAIIVLLEINGGSEHRYSSRLSGSLLYPYLTRRVQDLSVVSK